MLVVPQHLPSLVSLMIAFASRVVGVLLLTSFTFVKIPLFYSLNFLTLFFSTFSLFSFVDFRCDVFVIPLCFLSSIIDFCCIVSVVPLCFVSVTCWLMYFRCLPLFSFLSSLIIFSLYPLYISFSGSHK